tara:strand:+ start:514 stop:972 length:459 start_codon:yes stop_codon:yes gene_type:complete
MIKTDGNGSIVTFPYSEYQLRLDNPGTSFPKTIAEEVLASWNVYPVISEVGPPVNEDTHYTEANAAPTLIDGVWTLQSIEVEKTDAQKTEWMSMKEDTRRSLRGIKLQETDFYALTDVTMTSAMASYRQALRDITSHANWPDLDDADWPTAP